MWEGLGTRGLATATRTRQAHKLTEHAAIENHVTHGVLCGREAGSVPRN